MAVYRGIVNLNYRKLVFSGLSQRVAVNIPRLKFKIHFTVGAGSQLQNAKKQGDGLKQQLDAL